MDDHPVLRRIAELRNADDESIERVKDKMHEKPILSAGIALGVGCIVTKLFSRK
jgi:ElaB/YqjD/DUF883 family membrane-anchored ribosome-binding protein